MYYATGLPGFMRGGSFGRGGGMGGPCAQYLMTGQWPTPAMQAAWQDMAAQGAMAPSTPAVDPHQQVAMLQAQIEALQQQLEMVRRQIPQTDA